MINNNNLIEPTQFKLEQVTLMTKGGPIGIIDLVEEINIYDNLFLPAMSGQILIRDAAKIVERLAINNDVINFHIRKVVDSDFASFQRSFVIYSVSDRKNMNGTSEAFILNFVSSEFVFSLQHKMSISHKGIYSDLVSKILTNNLKIPTSKQSIVEKTQGLVKITVPNITPISAIEWCSKRSLSSRNLPELLFFANRSGYNFTSLSNLLSQDTILKINFSPKNLNPDEAVAELGKARGFEVISQGDSITRIATGVDSGTFFGFDPITRSFGAAPIDGNKAYQQGIHGNRNQTGSTIVNPDGTTSSTATNSKQVLKVSVDKRKTSNYVKKNDSESISREEDFSAILLQRQAILSRLMQKRLKIALPGNFQLSSGFNVEVEASGFGAREKGEDPNLDTSLSGKYIITGTRHILGSRQHVTVIEVASDSTTDTRKNQTTQTQLAAIQQYDRLTRAS